ncbi:MAG: hypothetical protein IID33_16755 [Planctomycetes bacterium]|nr:hypothetical protein [Planctomycetota bacterium]
MTGSIGAVLAATWLESAGTFLTILTPLVAVPLTVITFYLRSLREHQLSWHADLIRRVESIEMSMAELRRALADFERDYATKEEWLRECTIARGTLERLKESTVRIETRLESGCARGHSRIIHVPHRQHWHSQLAGATRDEGI